MRYIRWLTIFCLSMTLIIGCNKNSDMEKIKKQMSALEDQINKLEKEVTDLRFLSDLRWKLNEMAFLKPGDSGYSPLKFDLGVLTVSLDNISPYANGSKITLRFGNILGATISGLKATIEYGPVDENGLPQNDRSLSKEVAFQKTLRPMAWTTVEVVLERCPPSELGFVRLRDVYHTSISLYK